MKNILKQEQGLTLIEVLMAMLILTVGLLAVAILQDTAIKGNASANRESMGINVASNALEILIKRTDTLGLGNFTETDDPELSQYGDPDKFYVLTWNITAGPGNTKLIKMKVSWKEAGKTRYRELEYIKQE